MTRITLRDPSDEVTYIGAVCQVARVVRDNNAGCPVFHLYGEDGRYLAGFNAAHVALTPDDPDFEIPEPELLKLDHCIKCDAPVDGSPTLCERCCELLAPSIPLVESKDETIA